jgi:hypothetical protein
MKPSEAIILLLLLLPVLGLGQTKYTTGGF